MHFDEPRPSGEHDWRAAGDAWGRSANDWACLYEAYSVDAMLAVFRLLDIGPGVDLLDIACGSGMVARHAANTGATVAAIDASAELVEIARLRLPSADIRVGSMFDLPWPDRRFDAAISINGIWGGCRAALSEAARVLRPGGLLAITFWGTGPPLDLRDCFRAFARHAPSRHLGDMRRLNDISRPGVADGMLDEAGFDVVGRHRRISTVEWPDGDLAWRALRSVGPAAPALAASPAERVRTDVMAAIAHCRDARGVYRFSNDHQIVIARRRDRSPRHPIGSGGQAP